MSDNSDVNNSDVKNTVTAYVRKLAGAPAVWNAVLEAAADWDGEIPGRDRVRIIVAGAPPPSKTIARVEAELTRPKSTDPRKDA